ncbi:MAG: circadian clock protein KaiB [Magnetococcales bacterium]|nr:circadian clock protein KaiB [Magnetococcales bacterium]
MVTQAAPHFLLFVTAGSPIGERAADHFRALAKGAFADDHELEIIDIKRHPGRVEEHRILATPTLVRLSPGPPLKIVGDLSAETRLRQILGLPARGHPEPSCLKV